MSGVRVENGVLVVPPAPRFKGIPTPDQLGMGVDAFKAASQLRKAGKYSHTPVKGTGIGGGRGGKTAGKSAGKSTGGKK